MEKGAVGRGTRSTARIDEPFVVFVMGFRVNRFLALGRWVPALFALFSMLRSLGRERDGGFLGGQTYVCWRGVVLVQYWRSYEDLERYARCAGDSHLPAWQKFNRRVRKSGAVGLWHETYMVGAGQYEAVYANVPASGLAKATREVPAFGGRETARRRRIRDRTGALGDALAEVREKAG